MSTAFKEKTLYNLLCLSIKAFTFFRSYFPPASYRVSVKWAGLGEEVSTVGLFSLSHDHAYGIYSKSGQLVSSHFQFLSGALTSRGRGRLMYLLVDV